MVGRAAPAGKRHRLVAVSSWSDTLLPRDWRITCVWGPVVTSASLSPGLANSNDSRAQIMACVRDELLRSQSPEIQTLAREVARHYGQAVLGILFYGSCLRAGTADGLIDLYVIVDRYPRESMSTIGAGVARLLPPNVYHHQALVGGRTLRAKIAVISIAQLRRRIAPQAIDTTIWARFCQPMAMVYVRDAGAAEALTALVADSVLVAALWAARLGPEAGHPRMFWLALLRATYDGEIRVERLERIDQIHDGTPERYATLLLHAWRVLEFPIGGQGEMPNPLPPETRRTAGRDWHRRRRIRRALNILRLAKAAFTYDRGMEYIAWKIERHTSRRLALSAFQRRHPLLAIPSLIWQVVQLRILR